MRKTLSVLLAMLMLAACLPLMASADEVPTIVVLLEKNTLTNDYEDNLLTKHVEESLGINLDFEFLPAGEAGQKLNVMVAAGENLGDVIYMGMDNTGAQNYADAGAIIALDDYYAGLDTNAEAFGQANGIDMLGAITSLDGHIYGAPRYIGSLSNEMKYRAYVNQTWLENLGLEKPETTEALYNVLKAFKTQDANGNGDPNDEIPMLGSANTWACDPYYYLMNAFTYAAEDSYQIQDGKINFAYTTEGYREGLRYMRTLVSEGLLAEDTWSNSNSTYYESLSGEEVRVGVVFCSAMNGFGSDNPNLEQFRVLPALTGPEGECNVSYAPTPPVIYWAITADCKVPDLAFTFIDFMCTNDIYLRARYGVHNVHWNDVDQEGRDRMECEEGDTLLFETVDTWTTSNNIHWHGDMGVNAKQVQSYWNGEETYFNYQRWLGVLNYMTHKPGPGEYVPSLTISQEENDEISENWSAINTYWKESRASFIFGRMSLENDWDSYLSALESMKLARILEVVQTAYDRQYAK